MRFELKFVVRPQIKLVDHRAERDDFENDWSDEEFEHEKQFLIDLFRRELKWNYSQSLNTSLLAIYLRDVARKYLGNEVRVTTKELKDGSLEVNITNIPKK